MYLANINLVIFSSCQIEQNSSNYIVEMYSFDQFRYIAQKQYT